MLKFFSQYIHPSSTTRAKVSIHLIAQASTSNSVAAKDTVAKETREEQDNSRKKPPLKVKDVRAWKANLQLSAAAVPVKRLSEFEESKSKL
jgi:insulysin